MKRYWKVGIAAVALVVLAGAAVGLVAAQEDGNTPTPAAQEQSDATAIPSGSDATPAEKDTLRDQFLDGLAEQLGVSREQLDQAIGDSALAVIDQVVADGQLTEDEAARIRDLINSGEFPPFFGRHGHGYGGFAHGLCGGANLEDLAGFLGVEASVVRDGLENGQSLAQIAEANGKTRDELKSFLLSSITDKVNQAVADGKITQERADEKLENFSARLDDLIDRQGAPFRDFRFRGDHDLPLPPETPSDTETSLTL